jgi:hypothetical protein
MLLTKIERNLFRGPRQNIDLDGFFLSKNNAKSIDGVDYKPGFKGYILRGKDLNHSDFVHQLFELAIERMPDEIRFKGTYFRDATGPRLEAISENNWVISLCVSKSGRVIYSLYYRNLNPTKKEIIYNDISHMYPDAVIERKANSLDLLIYENYRVLNFDDINLVSCVDEFWNFVNNISKIKSVLKFKNNDGVVISTGRLIKGKNSVIRYYFTVAVSIYLATRFAQRHMLPRGGGDGVRTFDVFDEIIAIGATEAAMNLYRSNGDWKNIGIYREHAVPCKFIVDQAIINYQKKRFSRNLHNQIYEVALMIRRNLTLVYCTTDEAQKLDSKYRLIMPDGWNTKCGDVLERFHECNIPVYDFDGYQFMKS